MISRGTIMAMLDGLLAFGTVRASKQSTTTKQVLVSVRGNSDGSAHEERPYQSLWGHAAVLYRPGPDTELVFARLGDEMVPLASRELRWAIDVEEGEVVLRNLVESASSRARVHLKANGEVVIDSPKVYIGDGSATEKIALGTAIKSFLTTLHTELESLRSLYNAHVHPAGTPNTGAPTTTMPTAFTSVPDIESRHVVEN